LCQGALIGVAAAAAPLAEHFARWAAAERVERAGSPTSIAGDGDIRFGPALESPPPKSED